MSTIEPVSKTDDATARNVRSALTIMIVAAIILLAFNSSGLRRWSRDLPGNATTDAIVNAADTWHEYARSLGLTLPKRLVSRTVEGLKEADWAAFRSKTNTRIASDAGE